MALSWAAKAPTAVVEREWTPIPDTAVDSVSVVVTTGTATIAAEAMGDTVRFTVTGGANGVVQVFTATAVLGEQTLVETFYLPVETSVNRIGYTARDVCQFALRKVTGIAEEADADQLEDALERLNDMLALWRTTGADLGLELPVVAADVLYLPDAHYNALKFNLRSQIHEFYDVPLTPSQVLEARSSLAAVKNSMIAHRAPVYY